MKLKLLAVSALSGGILLAGCTSADVISAITNACAAVGAGLAVAAQVSGDIPGGAGSIVGGTVSTVISDVSADCPNFANAVGNFVGNINQLGGTASVTVASAGTTPAATKSLVANFGSPKPKVHFTVSPSGQVTYK